MALFIIADVSELDKHIDELDLTEFVTKEE